MINEMTSLPLSLVMVSEPMTLGLIPAMGPAEDVTCGEEGDCW